MTAMLALAEQGIGCAPAIWREHALRPHQDNGQRLSRVQCKSGRLLNGCVTFRPCNTYAHHPNPKASRRSYVGQIDDFAVFCPETRAVYLVPIDDVPSEASAALRIDPVRNGQVRKMRFAAAYEIAKIVIY